MYHSITFMDGTDDGIKNTYTDFHLVPTTRPVFKMPEVVTHYIDVPGSDGFLDLTEILDGYPNYGAREDSIEFMVLNDYEESGEDWVTRYHRIAKYFHGRPLKAILEDDPGYYYEGRFEVEWDSSKPPYSYVRLNYHVQPYKYELLQSSEEWEWNPFNFETGVIKEYYGFLIPANSTDGIGVGLIGSDRPCVPMFKTRTDIKFRVVFEGTEIPESEFMVYKNLGDNVAWLMCPDIVVKNGEYALTLKCTSTEDQTVDINLQGGIL